MYNKLNKLEKRIVWGKAIGFITSALAIMGIFLWSDGISSSLIVWGLLLWYPLMGFMIGLSGIINKHPLFGFTMHPWSGMALGAFMNLILFLFAVTALQTFFADTLGMSFRLREILILGVVEGAVVGLLIDYMITMKFGIGKQLLEK